jgi:tetratricopeptide (TPR) repeat protein
MLHQIKKVRLLRLVLVISTKRVIASSSITIKAEDNPSLEMVFTYSIIPSKPSKVTSTEADHTSSLTSDGQSNIQVSGLARLPLADACRIEMPGNRRNLDEAIHELKTLVDNTATDHPDKPHRLRTLGALYVRRFARVKDIKDLDEAIAVQRSAANLITLTDSQLKAGHLGDLADYLSNRFDRRKNLSDLDEAISALQEATQSMGCSDVAGPCHLDTLGYLLVVRFDLSKNPLDLDHAVSTRENSVRLTPDGHAHKLGHLSNLGDTYAKRFQYAKRTADLDNAIATLQDATQLLHDTSINKPHRLMKLGDLYHDRYTQFKRGADLDLAIVCHEDCVRLTPPSEACLFFHLDRLRILHRRRFQVSGNRVDLDAAITLHERAISISPRDNRPAQLNVLGSSYLARYDRYRDIRDIDQAVFRHQEAVDLTTDAHQRIGRLVNLGIALKNRFMATGNISDIDHAISAHKGALSSTQDGDPDRPCRLHNLATTYICRFKYFHEPQDIEEALSVNKKCVDATPPNHFHESSHLHSLGIALRLHFDHSGNRTSLDDAIEKHERAVHITPKNDQFRAMRLNSLGNAFMKRSEVTEDLSDLHQGISALEDAIHCSRADDPELPCLSNNLGSAYMTLFLRSGLRSDIDRAIHLFQTGITQMSESHARCAGHLSNLANAYSNRFRNFHDLDDLEASISRYRIAACSSSASPTLRLDAAIQWAQVANSVHAGGAQNSLKGYAVAIELLPRVAWLGRTVSSRYQELASLGSLCNEAAAVAITSGKYDMALEWLEVGRSIVWGQLLNLRTPLDDLRAVDSKLADELELVSVNLERAGREDPESSGHGHPLLTQSHHQLAQEWEVLTDKVRALPDFENFLRPKKLKQLSHAARLGPVVVINVHELRCDALVLHSEHITHVPLNAFSFSLGQDLRRALNQELSRGAKMRATAPASSYIEQNVFPRILSSLWTTVVEPVLASLKYTVSLSS